MSSLAIRKFLAEHRETSLSVLMWVVSLILCRHFAPSPTWLGFAGIMFVAALVPVGHLEPDEKYLRQIKAHVPQVAAIFIAVFALRLWDTSSVPSLLFLIVGTVLIALSQAGRFQKYLYTLGTKELSDSSPVRSRDRAGGEMALVGGVFYFADVYVPHFWHSPVAPVGLLIACLIAVIVSERSRILCAPFGRIVRGFVLCAALLAALRFLHRGSAPLPLGADVTLAFWLAVFLTLYNLATDRARSLWSRAENYRFLALGITGIFLLRGFATFQLSGAGDARWYGTMLADMVAQTRQGVFPVWTGQSIYQFNGSIYPLRVAPLFHHLGALLDLCTFQSLGIFALQNLLITVLGLAALYTCYICVGLLEPAHRWLSTGAALLFLSCPGVLGIAYNSDLYMSWTTLPFVPLAAYAAVKTFRDRGSVRTMLLLGFALGMCWWGHTPIALWLTLALGLTQLWRLLRQPPVAVGLLALASGAALFLAVAAYPVASVLVFTPEKGVNASAFQIANALPIVSFIREVFPAVLLPVSTTGRQLSDFQLGWALWAGFFVLIFHWRQLPRASRILLVGAAMLIVLLTPIPGLDLRLWSIVPAMVRNTTGNWVMNRLYLVLCTTILFSLAAGAAPLLARLRRYKGAGFFFLGAVAWSVTEASAFSYGSSLSLPPKNSYQNQLRPENIQLTRFAYLVFPGFPSWFTHGVMDPNLEQTIYSTDLKTVLVNNSAAAASAARFIERREFVAPVRQPSGFIELDQPIHLAFGHHYLLQFQWADELHASGVLEFTGPSFFRDYELPEYGFATSFGAGGKHQTEISLWTTVPGGEDVTVHYFPHGGEADSRVALPFATARLLEYDPTTLPIRTENLIPYTVTINSPGPGWLETPRMYQDAYRANVAGSPAQTRKSPEGLVAIAIPKGTSQVELKYVPSPALAALYWLALAAMAAITLWLGARTISAFRTVVPQP